MNDAEIRQTVFALRRRIHEHPEMGQKEFKTTALVAATLKRAGIPFKRHSPTGITAVLSGGSKGPCVALRGDMDALPLEERTQWAHRSKNPGVMHACGHDAHTAMVLTAALALAKERKELPGTIKFLFQPDEEGAGGAARMVRQGAMENPKVDAVFGVHVNPRFPAGTICVKPGPLMAAVDRFTLDIWGEGGHGAYPHEGKDAVVIAANVVTALQSVVSRRVDPVEPVVVTVGTIEGGRRYNILAESARLTGTVRTLSTEWRAKVPAFLKQVVAGVVEAHGGRYKLNYERLSPSVVNHPEMADLALDVARTTLGAKRALRVERPSMGGEDFSEFLTRAPGCYFYLGTGADQKTRRPWHHPSFFLHEESMVAGVKFLTALGRQALRYLS